MKDENPNPKNTQTQCSIMRRWFVEHPDVKVTGTFFFYEFGVTKAATRIGEIINGRFTEPLAINREHMVQVENRFGKKISVREYYLPKEELLWN